MGTNKLYWLCREFTDNIWGGIKNVDEVLDYVYTARHYPTQNVFTSFVLYKSKLRNRNVLLQLEEHTSADTDLEYIVKFYDTTEKRFQKNLTNWRMSTLYDKFLSLKINADKVDLVYSEHLLSDQILEIAEELYGFVHNYLASRRGLDEDQLKAESEKLTNTIA